MTSIPRPDAFMSAGQGHRQDYQWLSIEGLFANQPDSCHYEQPEINEPVMILDRNDCGLRLLVMHMILEKDHVFGRTDNTGRLIRNGVFWSGLQESQAQKLIVWFLKNWQTAVEIFGGIIVKSDDNASGWRIDQPQLELSLESISNIDIATDSEPSSEQRLKRSYGGPGSTEWLDLGKMIQEGGIPSNSNLPIVVCRVLSSDGEVKAKELAWRLISSTAPPVWEIIGMLKNKPVPPEPPATSPSSPIERSSNPSQPSVKPSSDLERTPGFPKVSWRDSPNFRLNRVIVAAAVVILFAVWVTRPPGKKKVRIEPTPSVKENVVEWDLSSNSSTWPPEPPAVEGRKVRVKVAGTVAGVRYPVGTILEGTGTSWRQLSSPADKQTEDN